MSDFDPFDENNLDNRQKDLNALHKKFEVWAKDSTKISELERYCDFHGKLLEGNYEDLTIEELEMLITLRKSRGAE